MAKGDVTRPRSVPKRVFDSNWEKTFGGDPEPCRHTGDSFAAAIELGAVTCAHCNELVGSFIPYGEDDDE